jgi:hypothetical protein
MFRSGGESRLSRAPGNLTKRAGRHWGIGAVTGQSLVATVPSGLRSVGDVRLAIRICAPADTTICSLTAVSSRRRKALKLNPHQQQIVQRRFLLASTRLIAVLTTSSPVPKETDWGSTLVMLNVGAFAVVGLGVVVTQRRNVTTLNTVAASIAIIVIVMIGFAFVYHAVRDGFRVDDQVRTLSMVEAPSTSRWSPSPPSATATSRQPRPRPTPPRGVLSLARGVHGPSVAADRAPLSVEVRHVVSRFPAPQI